MKQRIKKLTITSGVTVFGLAAAAAVTATPVRASAHGDSAGVSAQQTQASTHGEHAGQQSLRYELHATLREHAAMTVPALKAHLLAQPDEPALMAVVDANSVMVADTIERGYPGTRDTVLQEWRAHIAYYVEYADAAKTGDEPGKQQARQKLVDFTDRASSLLAERSDRLDKATLQQHLAMHGDQVLYIIDNMVAANYEEVYRTAHEAYEHMGMMADLLASGKVRQQWHHDQYDQ